MAETKATVAVELIPKNFNQFSQQTTSVGDAMARAGKSMGSTRTTFLYMAFGLMAAGGMMNRVSGVFGKAVNKMVGSYSEMEYQASVVGTVLGATAKETGIVADEMMNLSIKTGFSAKQVGEAMQGLAMAGFNLNQVLGATESILNMARVGMIEVNDAVNLAVGIFNGFDMQARDTNDVMQTMAGITGELVYAANESVVTIQGLAEAFKFVSASAELAGWSLEETTTILMVAGDNMIRAGIAGRQLRISLVKLQQIAAAQQGTMLSSSQIISQYKINLLDANKSLKGMADVVEELQNKLGTLTDVQRNSALATLFGTEALTLWSAMYKKNVVDLRRTELALEAVGAKEALLAQFGGNATRVLEKWHEQVLNHNVDLANLKEQLIAFKISADAADNIIKVITDTSKDWDKTIREASTSAGIVDERLKTLKGTTDILNSSINTLYASYGQSLGPMLKEWNNFLTEIVKLMNKLPDPLKMIVAIIILVGYTLFSMIGKMLTWVGTLMLVAAAQKVVNNQLIQMNGLMAEQIGYLALMKEGWALVSGSMITATRIFTKIGLAIVGCTLAIAALTISFANMIVEFRNGNPVMGTFWAIIFGITAVLWVLWLRSKLAALGITMIAARAAWAAFATSILTKATIRAAWAQRLWNITLYSSPLIAIVVAMTLLKNGLGVLNIIIGASILVWAYFNAVLWSNPIIIIVAGIFLLIGVLGELDNWINSTAASYQDSGISSPFFHDMQLDADAALVSIKNLKNGITGFKSGIGRGSFDVKGAFTESVGGRGNRVFAPRVNVNINGTQIHGEMSEVKLRRVVSRATTETISRLNSEFEGKSK